MRRAHLNRRRKNLEQKPKENNDTMQRLLANSAIILTVITAVLYFHGRNLYGGYLAYWGLGSDLFPISTAKTGTDLFTIDEV